MGEWARKLNFFVTRLRKEKNFYDYYVDFFSYLSFPFPNQFIFYLLDIFLLNFCNIFSKLFTFTPSLLEYDKLWNSEEKSMYEHWS